jgi:O-antigen ligase
MIALGIILMLFAGLSFMSTIHALGLWLAMLVTHGVLVLLLGQTGVHLPFYAGILMTLIILARGQWTGVTTNTLLLFGALLVVMIFAAFMGMSLDNSMLSLLLYIKAFMLALLIAGCVKNENDIKVMSLYFLASLLAGALYAIYQYITGTFTINIYDTQRAAGLRGDPNETAMLFVAGIPVAIYWLMNSTGKIHQLFFTVALIFLLVGIVLTGSRGGFVALIFVMFLIYVRRPTIKLTIVGILMVVMIGVLTPVSYWERINTLITGESEQNESLDGRKMLFFTGFNMFFQHPILGVGPGNFGATLVMMSSESGLSVLSAGFEGVDTGDGKMPVAHNLYLEFFAENGFIAGMLLLAIFIMSLRFLIYFDREMSHDRQRFGIGLAIALAMAGMLFSGLFLSQGKNSVLWFLVGLGFAAGQIISAHKKTKDLVVDRKQNQLIKDDSQKVKNKISAGVRLR